MVNFTGIEFISRAYADEFRLAQFQLKDECNIRVDICNAIQAVIDMLDIVSNPTIGRNIDKSQVPVLRFDNQQDLLKHFSLI